MRFAAATLVAMLALLSTRDFALAGDSLTLADFETAAPFHFVSANEHPANPEINSLDSDTQLPTLPDSTPHVEPITSEPLPPATPAPENAWTENQDAGEFNECQPPEGRFYVDGDVMALRTHFGEAAVGKLAERYEGSERLTLGYENGWGIGGRVRYWSYDRTTPLLINSPNELRVDFGVVDFEGTTRFETRYADLVISGGLRWANVKIDFDKRSRTDMPGGTIGLEVRGLICRDRDLGLVWRSVTGGRFSIFGTDWEGSQQGIIVPVRDDNITVMEIYGGFEASHCYCGHDLFARLMFESQNWRSDSMGANTGVDSMSFIGPSLSAGMIY
ncbi:MAG TPA: hypothetical protein VHU84_15280 [Lacipirellulaceae bacterium]|nr:hypothetical protein [Lacipirellulaceae bacterium]